MSGVSLVLTIAAAVGAGVAGGVFFAFSAFVMPALARVDAATGIRSMQAMNVTAVRPPLMGALFGTAAVAIAAGVASGDALVLAAVGLYLLCVVALTAAFHVPRNDRLAALDVGAGGAPAHWRGYLRAWTAGNHVRAVAAIAAASLLTAAAG